jgi:hypothetical protein
MPDEMADVLSTSLDFRPPQKGGLPASLQLEAEGGGNAVVIVGVLSGTAASRYATTSRGRSASGPDYLTERRIH